MDKKALRAEIRAKKRALTEEQIVRYSEELAQKLFAHPLYQAAKSIYGYMSYNQEVRTMPILRQAQADGKRVAVPKVYGDEMKFLWLDDLNRTVSGAYSIPEPVGDEPEAADETALILMPGAMQCVPKRLLISSAFCRARSRLMSTSATSAPSSASAAAVLRPMPPAAPVTKPFLPSKEKRSLIERRCEISMAVPITCSVL